MALVVSSSSLSPAPPNPTGALQAALTNFENVLTSEQRYQFLTQVQSFNQQRPDASSVIQFVAQIDALKHAKTRTSISSRLCTFLDATRQFAGIVDTFVSANPTIAALVWGGIKTTILVASNVASYFNKVTSMIMVIGQISPIYREFSHLYNDSVALQQALCDYYVVVIRLVTKVVEVSQHTGLTSLFSVLSPFESEFGPLQTELAEASQLVKLQISLAAKQAAYATARLVEFESRENQKHRGLSRKLASELRAERDTAQQIRVQDSIRRAAKTRSFIKDQLSTINHDVPWKRALKQRLTDTAEWFRDEQDFQAWKSDPHTATLWCPGRMGVGKTVLMSYIIAYLHLSLQPGDIISYHFCHSEDIASLSARNILGTLARQILYNDIDNAHGDQLQSLRDKSQDIDMDGMVDLLLSHLRDTKTYYLIVDGLDECNHDQSVALAKSVAKICESSGQTIKVLYSGRPELERQLFRKTKPNYRLPISKAVVNADIELYVKTELDMCLEEEKIQLANPETIWRIRDALCAQHDGLILFVRLFIEELCMLGNEDAILKALSGSPKTISDLLATRVRRVREHHLAKDALRILRHCGCTRRPLTVDEFSELLSISVSQTSLDRTRVPQNMDQIIAACYGLIYVEEEEATIHYLHHSVKQHLFTNLSTRQEGFVENETDMDLGHLCLTYLNFNDFKRQIARVNPVSKKLVRPIDMGLVSTKYSSSIITGFARKLLHVRQSSHHLTSAELARRAEDILGEVESSRMKAESESRQFYLLDYVQTYWIWHLSRLEESSRMWPRFLVCVRGEHNLARRPWVQDNELQPIATVSSSSTAWALVHVHTALLLYDVIREPYTLSKHETQGILRYAIDVDNHHLVRAFTRLKHRRRDIIEQCLHFTAKNGHENFVDLFINSGGDLNAVNSTGWTALQAAAAEGHSTVVERLLAANADVNAAAAEHGGRTALQAAAERGYFPVVERLSGANAIVDGTAAGEGLGGLTALQAAAERGHLPVVERLLAAGADVDAAACQGLSGRTALQAAAEGGHLAVVERLKLAGARE